LHNRKIKSNLMNRKRRKYKNKNRKIEEDSYRGKNKKNKTIFQLKISKFKILVNFIKIIKKTILWLQNIIDLVFQPINKLNVSNNYKNC